MNPYYKIVAESKEVPDEKVHLLVVNRRAKERVKESPKYHVVLVVEAGEISVTPDLPWRHCIDYLSCVCVRPEYVG